MTSFFDYYIRERERGAEREGGRERGGRERESERVGVLNCESKIKHCKFSNLSY